MIAQGRPIAVTGARGRLGRAIVAAAPVGTLAWSRPAYDLDEPESATALVAADRPSLVIHAAAMTAVDDAARDPTLAMRRNVDAVASLALACHEHDAGLLLVSTNEVFDGARTDGRGYDEDDPPAPRNPYGASKLAGEDVARDAFGDAPGLWIVRTAWLYGAPGKDFPEKIVAAADRLPPDEPLPVVEDEHGSPTWTVDLAAALLALVEASDGGLFHLTASGVTSRLGWARRVLAIRRPGRATRPIPRSAFERASDPPPWGVLDTSRAAAVGVRMRPWEVALDAYLGAAAAVA
jgi:dTDP-4-dehydrorhamnose reductase